MNATRMNLPGMALALGVGLVLASPVSAQEAKDRPAEGRLDRGVRQGGAG